jgi:hypothetical protein
MYTTYKKLEYTSSLMTLAFKRLFAALMFVSMATASTVSLAQELAAENDADATTDTTANPDIMVKASGDTLEKNAGTDL